MYIALPADARDKGSCGKSASGMPSMVGRNFLKSGNPASQSAEVEEDGKTDSSNSDRTQGAPPEAMTPLSSNVLDKSRDAKGLILAEYSTPVNFQVSDGW